MRRRSALDVREVPGDGSPAQVEDLVVRGFEVDHACGAPPLAVTLELHGTTVGYSGDTAWTPSLPQAARPCDVFVCEACTYDRQVRYHLSYASVREHRDELGDGRLVLTHLGSDLLAHLAEVDDETAYDGLVLDL